MPPRDSELPEGTDHIINGAMETGSGASASTGSSGTGSGGTATGGDTGGGFIGSDADDRNDDTGGTASGVKGQLQEGFANLRGQATDRVLQFAQDGKTRASDALDEFSRIVEEAAGEIEERLGEQYGSYARRAADAVSGFSSNIREREVEDLYEDAREFVRKSPGVAIGAAAAIGFVLMRVIKSGLPDQDGPESASGDEDRKGSRKGKSA